MKKIFLALALVMLSSPAMAEQFSCAGEITTRSTLTVESTDSYLFLDGKLYHSYQGRPAYLYGTYEPAPQHLPKGFVSGHMRFYIINGRGYVIIADNIEWKVITLVCE